MRTKYIFVAGGVMSGVGKGVTSVSIANILQSKGFKVTSIKIDPYVNVDAGTMNPTEHGEVFVLDDGMECDQDMGNYERFLNKNIPSANYMTTGSVYQSIISKERSLEYEGRCVSVVPDVPIEILGKIDNAVKRNKAEIVVTEIGGTVGEYQNILFLEAVRILKLKNPKDVLLVLVSFLPTISDGGELKTKSTQHAVKTLNIPLNFEKDGISGLIAKKLKIKPRKKDLKEWKGLVDKIKNSAEPVKIGIIGKYFSTGDFLLSDSYISVIEAVKHAAYYFNRKPATEWLNAEEFEQSENLSKLKQYDGIIVPGGFGNRGVEGKIAAIKYCRENRIPILGICYGMQLMVVEFARHIAGLKGAHTTEVNSKTPYNVIDILPEQKEKLKQKDYGGSMRLGAYEALVKKDTIAHSAYGVEKISERHRHRYEVNPDFIKQLEENGIVFSCQSPGGKLVEIVELPESTHPFFLGAQFHPEFKSRPLNPHPLFLKLMEAITRKK